LSYFQRFTREPKLPEGCYFLKFSKIEEVASRNRLDITGTVSSSAIFSSITESRSTEKSDAKEWRTFGYSTVDPRNVQDMQSLISNSIAEGESPEICTATMQENSLNEKGISTFRNTKDDFVFITETG
jgi:hypothetical protein